MARQPVGIHPTDEALELYALGRLAAAALTEVEEHLLICHPCQDRFVEVDRYVVAMREVCRERRFQETNRSSARTGLFSRLMSVPKPVWAGIAAMLAVGVSAPILTYRNPVTQTEVRLTASRGVGTSEPARAGKIHLSIEVAELPVYPNYRVSIVTAAGAGVWAGDLKPENGTLSFSPPARLSPGQYWVRVGSPNQDPIREYALALH